MWAAATTAAATAAAATATACRTNTSSCPQMPDHANKAWPRTDIYIVKLQLSFPPLNQTMLLAETSRTDNRPMFEQSHKSAFSSLVLIGLDVRFTVHCFVSCIFILIKLYYNQSNVVRREKWVCTTTESQQNNTADNFTGVWSFWVTAWRPAVKHINNRQSDYLDQWASY